MACSWRSCWSPLPPSPPNSPRAMNGTPSSRAWRASTQASAEAGTSSSSLATTPSDTTPSFASATASIPCLPSTSPAAWMAPASRAAPFGPARSSPSCSTTCWSSRRGTRQLGPGVVADVHEQEAEPAERDARALACRPATPAVVVARAGRHVRDGTELGEHFFAADVPGVQDVIDAAEHVAHLRSQEAMRIRDDADAHGCSIRRPMRLLCDTPREWVELALERFDEVLVDHAHCEKKAAAQALSMLAAFPMVAGLPRAMARLAREEAGPLAQVLSVMEKRGLPLGRDPGDPYAQGLQALGRQPPPGALVGPRPGFALIGTPN